MATPMTGSLAMESETSLNAGSLQDHEQDPLKINNGASILNPFSPEVQIKVGAYLEEDAIARLSCVDQSAFNRGYLGEFSKDTLAYDLTKVPVAYVIKILENSCPHSLGLFAVNDETLKQLLPYMGSLKTLTMHGDPSSHSLTDTGAIALAQAETLKNLTALDLHFNEIDTAGAQAIAQSPYLSNLTRLNLRRNNIRDAGAEAIAQSQMLNNLTFLGLGANLIGTAGAQAIAQSIIVKNLIFLDLVFNDIKDAGAQGIAQSPYLTNLKTLDLQCAGIKDAGAKAIAESQTLINLKILSLRMNNSITDEIEVLLSQRFGDGLYI